MFVFVPNFTRIEAALVSCYDFIIVVAVNVLGQGHCFCPLKGYPAICARPHFYDSWCACDIYTTKRCFNNHLTKLSSKFKTLQQPKGYKKKISFPWTIYKTETVLYPASYGVMFTFKFGSTPIPQALIFRREKPGGLRALDT